MVTNDKKVSDSPVQVSSFLPLVIPGEVHPYSESMQNFCTQWILNNRMKQVISDPRSSDIYCVPLKKVIFKFDRTYICNLSTEQNRADKKDGNIHPFRHYVMFSASIAKQKMLALEIT